MPTAVDKVMIEIWVVLGKSEMPIRHLLKMGRGAVIDLDAAEDDECWIYANSELIARGEIMIIGEKLGISITQMVNPADL